MEEIKLRIEAIKSTNPFVGILNPRIIEEFCYLQLRMICELIALGCLLVHGDIEETQTSKIQKAYAADWILETLAKLHKNFYPTPGKQITSKDGKGKTIEIIKGGYLTQENLPKLYHKCGAMLHKGNLRTLRKGSIRTPDFASIQRSIDEIMQLLNHHQIQLIAGNEQIWVMMNESTTGRVRAFSMLRIGDA